MSNIHCLRSLIHSVSCSLCLKSHVHCLQSYIHHVFCLIFTVLYLIFTISVSCSLCLKSVYFVSNLMFTMSHISYSLYIVWHVHYVSCRTIIIFYIYHILYLLCLMSVIWSHIHYGSSLIHYVSYSLCVI